MGTGVSREDEEKQTNLRVKVQAVTAFESAGRKHREKRKSPLDKRKTKQNGKSEGSKQSGWDRAREKSLSKLHVKDTSLRLSDFNKITRKTQLDEEDIKPVDIPYITSEKVQPEELCHVCSVYTGRETYPCRICYKVYHEGCLRKLGQCKDPASSALLKRAVKPVGWSCHKCDNLSNVLTEEEMCNLMAMFERHEVMRDSSISLEDYLDFRKRVYNELTNSEMERDQIQEETRTYHRVDKDSTGSITWWEFLNFETTRILQQRHKNSLLHLLHKREIELARRLFQIYDEEHDGVISEHNARKAIATWYTLFLEPDETLHGYAIMSQVKTEDIGKVITENLTFTMDDETSSERTMSWNDYLLELAIYIIAARSNLSPVPVEGSEWTKSVVVSTEMDCDLKRTSL